jgi:hypothetical protein
VTPEQWARVKAIFAEASERPSGERAAFLEHACGYDAALRHEVESLLAVEEDASGFLATPAAVIPPAAAMFDGARSTLQRASHRGTRRTRS